MPRDAYYSFLSYCHAMIVDGIYCMSIVSFPLELSSFLCSIVPRLALSILVSFVFLTIAASISASFGSRSEVSHILNGLLTSIGRARILTREERPVDMMKKNQVGSGGVGQWWGDSKEPTMTTTRRYNQEDVNDCARRLSTVWRMSASPSPHCGVLGGVGWAD